MKPSIKYGLIGFGIVFVGLLIVFLFTGHDSQGWKCTTLKGASYCSFFAFFFSLINWAYLIIFSMVGFAAGIIDYKIIKKTTEQGGMEKQLPLKIASTITLTIVIVFGIIGFLTFNKWVQVMIYVIIFALFVMLVAWVIGKKRYRL
jgi:drug/metabolite transporter (DMT)-like permease